jgi:uncharacterized protein (DUF1501 family)
MKRRNFLKTSALASTAWMVPSFLQGLSGLQQYQSRSGKILIVIQLSGGNDGLNTVVPFQNDIYYKNRPKLAIQKNEVLRVSDDLGFNPNMTAMQSLYDEGLVSVVNSVGYPNPDRSHFRSMDIWHTASDSSEYWSSGWLGRYLDSECERCSTPHHALEIDDSLSLAMKGITHSGYAMSDPKQLKKTADNKFLKAIGQQSGHHHEHDDEVAYLYKTMIDTQASADYLYEKSKVYNATAKYPKTQFGRSLKQIAELITADTDTRIYYVSLTGFDTHVNQQNKQGRLLKEYAEGVKALTDDLKANNLLNDTLIMTFSEFGRRVKQNGSNGTDHGTANNLFLIGGQLKKPGFFNPAPDLVNLDNGDLIYQVDFRDIYTSVLNHWLDADAPKVLGKGFKGIDLI